MNVASYIDHTVLKPTTVLEDIMKLCDEAREYRFAAVCVPPPFVKASAEFLDGTDVKIATVAGFPFGYSAPSAKLAEAQQAMADGADELDVVINISAAKSGLWEELRQEMKPIIDAVRRDRKVIKIIIESGVLTDDEIVQCCHIYASLGTDFVKTSTGYADTGATLRAVQLMREHLPSEIRIKASGGIRTFDAVMQFIDAGAARIGTSAGVAIMKQQLLQQ
jgi:deoxyribose-phosphate aldolase